MVYTIAPFSKLLQAFTSNTPTINSTLDERINQSFHDATSWFTDAVLYQIPITQNIAIPWVLIVLVGGALYFSIFQYHVFVIKTTAKHVIFIKMEFY